MSSRDRDVGTHRQAPKVPWHQRTSTLLGVSVAGLAAIALLIASISFVAGQFNEPEQAPINYVGPASPATSTRSSTPTTTATITSTRAPITSDINPDLTPSSTPSSSTPSSVTSAPEASSRNPNYQPPRTREPQDSSAQTTRNRPRTNVTRTLDPAP